MKTRKMKDSGVEWIGAIPEGWEVNRIGSYYTQRNEKVSDKDYPPLSVTMKGILPQLETAAKTDDGDNRKLVRKGDFAINSRSDRRGACGISAYDGSVSLINTILSPRGKMDPKYYNWFFHTPAFADEFYKWGHGIVDDLWTTRWSEMKRIAIPYPPFPEQRAIASYLDDRCAKIDAMIGETKALIEEYKTWRQSLIFEAVTGKRPVSATATTKNAKGAKMRKGAMRDSGVEWIGAIPEDWEMCRLKNEIEIRSDMGAYNPETDYYIGLENVVSCGGYVESDTKYDCAVYAQCKKGDLLYSKLRPYLSKCIQSPFDGFCTGEFLVVSRYDGPMGFLRYWFQSAHVTEAINASTSGSKMPRASESFIRDLPFPKPPSHIQRAIADYLDAKCAAIDRVVAEKEALIADLEQYRKSLIFECVTGKRVVA